MSTNLISKLPKGLRILHWVIIINFMANIIYGMYQIFFVLGSGLPLFGAAKDMPHEQMLVRRLYASEVWISITGLCIYVGLTYYLPRLIALAKSDANQN